ncbi:distal tail protein Dit [Streptococcus fryi]
MTAEMTFNGVDMSRFFRITDIIRPIGNKRSVSTDSAPALGVNIQQVKRAEKEHTIKFDMKASSPVEMEQLKHDLAGVLNVLEPVKITYGDEPDKYYLGMPVDDITPDNLTRWFQRSELKLIIPDGVAHSSSYKRLKSQPFRTQKPKITFDITNAGTVPTYPIIKVKHHSENGYIGLVNSSGALELGYRDGTSPQPKQSSLVALDFGTGDNITKAIRNGVVNQAVTPERVGLSGKIDLFHNRLQLPQSKTFREGNTAWSNSLDGHLDFTTVKTSEKSKIVAKNRPRFECRDNLDSSVMDIWQTRMTVYLKANTTYTLTARGCSRNYVPGQKDLPYIFVDFSYGNDLGAFLDFKNRDYQTDFITFTTPENLDEKKPFVIRGMATPEDQDWTGLCLDWYVLYEGEKSFSSYPTNDASQYMKYRYIGLTNSSAISNPRSYVWQKETDDATERSLYAETWKASSLSWDIPETSLNESIWWSQLFKSNNLNCLGKILISVSDRTGMLLYGFSVEKNEIGSKAVAKVFGKNGEVMRSWDFKVSDKLSENPYADTSGVGHLMRQDEILKVNWFGTFYTLQTPLIKGHKASKVHLTFFHRGAIKTLDFMSVGGLIVRRDFVTNGNEVPNRYYAGSEVVIDCESDTIFLDGQNSTRDLVDGSDWLEIPPGNSQLDLFVSSNIQDMPDVTILFEERWL